MKAMTFIANFGFWLAIIGSFNLAMMRRWNADEALTWGMFIICGLLLYIAAKDAR